MKVNRVMVALLAGTVLSAAAAAEPVGRQAGGETTAVVKPTLRAPQFEHATVIRPEVGILRPVAGKGINTGPVVRGPAIDIVYDAIGDCTGISRIVDNATDLRSPAALFDDGFFTPGPAAGGGAEIVEMDALVWPQQAMTQIFVRITFFDSIFPEEPIVQADQLFSATYVIEGTVANTTPGAYVFTFDTTGLNLPDDDWGVEIAFLDALDGEILDFGITTGFGGAACAATIPTIGANAAIWWTDGDNYPAIPFGNGVRYEPFDPDTGLGDAFAWGAGGPSNALFIQLRGTPNIPPVPTGSCCVAGACLVRTADDCATLGGLYGGDGTDCNGTWNATSSDTPLFGEIPDNDPNGATFLMNVAAGEVITDLDVGLVISHSWQGDLEITLTHVDSGTSVVLVETPGGGNFGTDNFGDLTTFEPFILDDAAELVYDTPVAPRNNVHGRWKPVGSLAAFNGLNSAGQWQLKIVDTFAGDVGFVFQWDLAVNQPNDICPEGPAFCDADWCQDGSVGVPDIFCFLSEWFALVPEARNYGGTPGVPAIFAFLSVWFSTGQGPCTP